jgi:uncharacterized membrane protein YGL010W
MESTFGNVQNSPALVKVLAQYAGYHRCRRNILTHFIGVPLIVFSVMILLARPGVSLGSFYLSAMWIGIALTTLYYCRLELQLGALMGVILVLGGWLAQPLAHGSMLLWLGSGIGIFVFGWVLQFIGHHYEQRKPAFVDDLIGLMIGPIFVTAELLFLLGLRKSLEHDIVAIAGPTRP